MHTEKQLRREGDKSTVRSPSYKGYQPASPQASRVKQRNRAKGTMPEILVRRALWQRGLRYRLHVAGLPGRPDLVFPREKVVVFCDGDFWHGRDWEHQRPKIARRANADYWLKKIETNMLRDVVHTEALTREGWTVLRFWEGDIKRDCERIAAITTRAIRNM
jgi:DNA mismatch endonuclease (patch repair protein)